MSNGIAARRKTTKRKTLSEPPASHLVFDRSEWAALRSNTPLALSDEDLIELRGVNESVSVAEVAEIYLPLSRLLNLHVAAAKSLGNIRDTFLGRPALPSPYVIGIAGSVAVGKSTFSRVLRAVLARWPDHPHVALVTTDGFLHPNRVLEERGLMGRKGFPESYDLRRMIAFLAELKAGAPHVQAPIYSHSAYDILPGEVQTVRRPDIVIFEGLNVLQTASVAPAVASDFFNFSVYIDAAEEDIESWFIERFLLLQRTAFQNPEAYFHRYSKLSLDEAVSVGHGVWRDINLVNLQQNILPTRERARLVLHKGRDHAVDQVWLRKT